MLPHVKGNVGFIFTNSDLAATRDVILAEKVKAPARAGAIAPLDVFVPAGNTGMEPGKTSFFQALGVPTKIARGTIEITTDLKLVESGSKVGASEATLLNMLNISPFTYGMTVSQVYDGGQTFSPAVLDVKEEQLLKALTSAITTIATISLAANYPTLPSIMHSLVNGYKKALAIAIETDYSWEGIEELKDRIANPEAYAAAAPAATSAADEKAPAKEEEKAKDESEESSGDEGIMSPSLIENLLLKASRVWWIVRLDRMKLSQINLVHVHPQPIDIFSCVTAYVCVTSPARAGDHALNKVSKAVLAKYERCADDYSFLTLNFPEERHNATITLIF